MKRNWKIYFYETIDGKCQVKEFVLSRDKNNRQKIYSILTLLKEKGINLTRPFSDFLVDGIHELRIQLSGEATRTLYFFSYKDYIILTHTFIKRSDKVPISEIQKANKIRIDFLNRYNEDNIEGLPYDKF